MASVSLVPVNPKTKEAIKDKPTLSFAAENSILFLGDNDETGIVDPALSHKVVKIYIKRRKILAFCCPDGRGSVLLNQVPVERGTRRELRAGSLISLLGSEGDEYMYRVEGEVDASNAAEARLDLPTGAEAIEISNDTPTTTAAAASIGPAASLPAEIGEEVICAICMVILVEPRTMVPCGHTCCQQCLATQSGNCAECRAPIQNSVPCRALKNMVEKLVEASQKQEQPIFEKEDIESYKQRVGARTAPPSGTSARKRRRMARRATGGAGSMFNPRSVLDLTN